MNKAYSLSLAIFAVSSTALLNAAVIAEWTFNAGANSTARLASSGVPAGATISGLSFNSSFTDVGPGAVPNDVHDGFGFGGNSGDQVIFLHRANYFDGSAVPSPRPTVSDYTSWGQGSAQGTGADLSSNGNAPIAFTIGADAVTSVTVDSLTIDFTSGGASIWQIQEAGAAQGAGGYSEFWEPSYYRGLECACGDRSGRKQNLHHQRQQWSLELTPQYRWLGAQRNGCFNSRAFLRDLALLGCARTDETPAEIGLMILAW